MSLHSYTQGDPSHETVILIHGILGSGRNFISFAKSIAKNDFYVITYDQKGHGYSPHQQNYDLEDLSKDVFEIMDTRKIQTAHLVGHSLGGRVALQAAALHPQRVKSLTMMDVSCRPIKESIDELKNVIDPLPLFFLTKPEAEAFLTKHLSQIPTLEASYQLQLKQFFLSNLRHEGSVFKWIFDLQNIRTSLTRALETDQTTVWQQIQCPILLIRGSHSTHFNKKEQDFLLSKNSLAQAKVIPHAGHWVHVDNFQETIKTIIEFLKPLL